MAWAPLLSSQLLLLPALLASHHFMSGNAMTSRMDAASVSSMTRRSIPIPTPPVGGMPYSRAVTKSSSSTT